MHIFKREHSLKNNYKHSIMSTDCFYHLNSMTILDKRRTKHFSYTENEKSAYNDVILPGVDIRSSHLGANGT